MSGFAEPGSGESGDIALIGVGEAALSAVVWKKYEVRKMGRSNMTKTKGGG